MKLIIIISVIFILFCIFFNNIDKFADSADNKVINLGSNVVNTDHNIFYGYSKPEAVELKDKLRRFKEIDISKSNLILDDNITFGEIPLNPSLNIRKVYIVNPSKYKNSEYINDAYVRLGSGIQYKQIDGKFIINIITTNSPADKLKKIFKGDIIVAINDQPVPVLEPISPDEDDDDDDITEKKNNKLEEQKTGFELMLNEIPGNILLTIYNTTVNSIDGEKFNSLKNDPNKLYEKISFRNSDDQNTFYNHISQKMGSTTPKEMCIGEQCLEKKHLSMINGNNTIKIKQYNSNLNYMQPVSVHYGGEGSVNQCEECKPKPEIFYELSPIADKPKNPFDMTESNGSGGIAKYNLFTKYALQLESGKFLTSYPSGGIGLSDTLGVYQTFHNYSHGGTFERFMTDETYRVTGWMGIANVWNRWLCNDRNWLGSCRTWAVWNRSGWSTWEKMRFIRASGTTIDDLSVYIMSTCGLILIVNPWGYFGGVNDSTSKHAKFKIIPIYDNCSENCKANYGSSYGIEGSDEVNVPKNLRCPRDRPICRFYNQDAKVLGKCFKEDQDGTFDQKSPHHYKFARANRSGYKLDNKKVHQITTDENEKMFNEFTIDIAKNKKNQKYQNDVLSHVHGHVVKKKIINKQYIDINPNQFKIAGWWE
jgi:hypothetical protein